MGAMILRMVLVEGSGGRERGISWTSLIKSFKSDGRLLRREEWEGNSLGGLTWLLFGGL
jgi:hypothetical protein